MKLYLLRHAEAAPITGGRDNPGRPLTEKGIEQAQIVAAEMKAGQISFDMILASPYLRASQTAEIIAAELELLDKLVREPILSPGIDFNQFMELLDDYQRYNSLLVVGHEPDLGLIAGELLCLEEARPLKKAEWVEIDVNE